MPNIRLILEYNGTKFNGWQAQTGARSIQAELEKALSIVLRKEIKGVIASGRTDAGVHAKAQVVNFHLEDLPDLNIVRRGVSSLLRGEVSVLSAEVVADDFHSRFSAKSKHYRYTILNRDTPPVLDWGKVWFVHHKLDIERMKKEALILEGRHDFKSFQAAGCWAKNSVKEIFSSKITQSGSYIYYDVIGSGFLKQMVRNIVGTLVRMGRGGEFGILTMQELLNAKDRKLAGSTAPAMGLCLEEVRY